MDSTCGQARGGDVNDAIQTSEELHGIVKQPEPTCPMIDAIVKKLHDAESHMRRYERCDDISELHNILWRVEREFRPNGLQFFTGNIRICDGKG